MKRIRSRKVTSASAAPGSVKAVKDSPSSYPKKACSTWPCGLRISTPVQTFGASASRCWVVSECSQVSRSGPETRTTSWWERSTKPSPDSSVRCSPLNEP